MFARLIKFLSLGATPSVAAISGIREPMGYQQISAATLAAATHLTVPSGAISDGKIVGYVVVQCVGEASTDYAAWRDDGTAPTNLLGMRLYSGQELDYTGNPYTIQFIVGAGAPSLNISYYF
jgi:hypothetical protein